MPKPSPAKTGAATTALDPFPLMVYAKPKGWWRSWVIFAPRARVLSSPSLRCLQTMGPVASAQHLSVEETDDLAEGQSSVAVRLVRAVAGQEVVVCTHGDVIAEILVALADEDRLDLGQNPRQAKGSVWALDGRKGSFTSAKYYAPVVVDAT